MATGGAWAAGVTAGGVVGVRGEAGTAGVGVGVAGLRLLLYMGALCLNCAGRAGLGVLGSSGGRLASREGGAVSTVRLAEGPGGGDPSPKPCASPALLVLTILPPCPACAMLSPEPWAPRLPGPQVASGRSRGSATSGTPAWGGHRLQRALPWTRGLRPFQTTPGLCSVPGLGQFSSWSLARQEGSSWSPPGWQTPRRLWPRSPWDLVPGSKREPDQVGPRASGTQVPGPGGDPRALRSAPLATSRSSCS